MSKLDKEDFQNKIQVTSEVLAELYTEAYDEDRESPITHNLLEAYRSVRRARPMIDHGTHKGKHVGHIEASIR